MSAARRSTDSAELASSLSPELLVLRVRADVSAAERSAPLVAEHDGHQSKAMARWLHVSAADDAGDATWLLTVMPSRPGSPIGHLVTAADGRRSLTTDTIESMLCEPAEFGADLRTRTSAAARARIQAFLARAPREHRIALGPTLASALAEIRDVLRERLPTASPSLGLAGALEAVTALDARSFWLTGWIRDADAGEVRLTAISPEGSRSEVKPAAIALLPTPEGADVRFHALVELDSPSCHPRGWILELRGPSGTAIEVAATTPLETGVAHVLPQLLDVLGDRRFEESGLAELALPVVAALRGTTHHPRVEQAIDYGRVPATAETSIVVATRDPDRIQLQLAEFARDPEFADPELIFVAHSPTPGGLPTLAAELHALYGMPFRLVELSRPARRARALNLGAGLARGRRLLLISGDAIPSSTGWLEALRAFLGRSREIGVVVPKLLRADDTIASAGCDYARAGEPPAWKPRCQFMGSTRTARAANVPRRVQASSDACLMLNTAQFHRCGGFADLYLGDGGREAADLCLRLAGAGLETWYVPNAELYLLDHSATPAEAAPGARLYNDWLFDKRWAATLAAEEEEEPRVAGLASIPPGPRIERLEVVVAEASASWVSDAGVVLPTIERSMSPYAGTYSFAIEGWVRSDDGSPVTVEANADGAVRARTLADATSDELTARFPAADGCGWHFVLGSLTLPTEFEVTFEAVHADGSRALLGRTLGRRRPLRSPYRPTFQPVIVTTLGRTGSNWMLTLLSQHPGIVVYRPFVYEPMMARYCADVLCALSEPTSYMRSILPQLLGEHWWLGIEKYQLALPLSKPGADMGRWLGREYVESLAGFFQGRIDAFYEEVAHGQGKARAKRFAEKSTPTRSTRTITELYPDGREIVLVRDFRDRLGSILAYNAKRGMKMWGHDGTTSDEEWFVHLRSEASGLVEYWQQRQERAHLVRYEDLIAAPESTMAAVFTYLGLEAGHELVQRTIMNATRFTPHGQTFHRTAPSVEASIGRWKRELSPERRALCAAAFDDLLVEFGYEPTGDLTATGT